MCGPDNSNRPRGGALAALTPPPPGSPGPASLPLQGDLTLHTPGHPASSSATHARFTPAAPLGRHQLAGLDVVIHSFGDLTKHARDCGHFCQFSLPGPPPHASIAPGDGHVELPLASPLALEVGDRGVIGRRVSVFRRDGLGAQAMLVAEGIVGFNF